MNPGEHRVTALQKLPVVRGQIRLALGSVDEQGVDLREVLGPHLHVCGEARAPQAHKHPVALLDMDFAGRTHMLPHGQDDLFRNRQLLRGQVGCLLVMGDLRAGALPQQGFEIHSSLPPMSLEVDWIFLYYSNSISPAMLICTNKNCHVVHFDWILRLFFT